MAFLLKLVVGDQDLPYSKIEKDQPYHFMHAMRWSACPGVSKNDKVRISGTNVDVSFCVCSVYLSISIHEYTSGVDL